MDDAYAAAHYNLGMCHLAMVGMDRVDLDHYFGHVIERFPDHYDAHFKLGVFYESLRYYDKAMKAYSRQLAVNPAHPITPSRLAHVAMRLKAAGEETHSLDELQDMAKTKPKDYLPLLAQTCIERGDFARAQKAFEQYFRVLGPDRPGALPRPVPDSPCRSASQDQRRVRAVPIQIAERLLAGGRSHADHARE